MSCPTGRLEGARFASHQDVFAREATPGGQLMIHHGQKRDRGMKEEAWDSFRYTYRGPEFHKSVELPLAIHLEILADNGWNSGARNQFKRRVHRWSGNEWLTGLRKA